MIKQEFVRSNLYHAKNFVIKELKWGTFTEEHFNLYKKFSKDKNYCVPVKTWESPTRYSMEKIKPYCTLKDCLLDYPDKYKIPNKNIAEALQVFCQIYTDCIQFSHENLPQGQYFMHQDMYLKNLVFTHDLKVKLLDIDSFIVIDEIMSGKYIASWNQLAWLVSNRIQNV